MVRNKSLSIGVKSIELWFPSNSCNVQQLISEADFGSEAKVYFQELGVDSIQIAPPGSGYDLAKNAGKKLLSKESIDPKDIDLLIMIQSRLPTHLISSESARLQYELGLDNADVVSVSGLGCADMTMAMKLARNHLIATAESEHVLICFGCSAYMPSRFRYPVTINGDGGIAILIGRAETMQILDVAFKTNGKYWDLFKIDYQESHFELYKEECKSEKTYGFELAIESRNNFKELNESLLRKNGLEWDQIDHVIMQNLSSRAYEYYGEALGMDISPICAFNLSQFGHLGPMDIFLNMHAGITDHFFQQDDYVLIMNNSPVAAWSTIIIKI